MKGYSVNLIGTALVLGAAGMACGGPAAPPPATVTAPHVLGLANYTAAIGTPIQVFGSGFPSFSNTGYQTQLLFVGTFTSASGASEPVHIVLPVEYIDGGTVSWTSFGPYANPMGLAAPQIGNFHGTIAAELVDTTGQTVATDTEPSTFDFTIQPSVAVQSFQPTSAACVGPVLRALAGAPYSLHVVALGFTPTSYTYTLTVPGSTIAPITLTHATSLSADSVGDHNELVMPAMPADTVGYDAVISVTAMDTAGQTHTTAFAMGVHNPVEIFYNGNVQVAQTFPPTVVSACIPGGEESRSVSYDETTSETRSRTLSTNWDNNWLQMHTLTTEQSMMMSMTHEASSSNTVDISTTNGSTFGWSYGSGTMSGSSTSFNGQGGINIGVFSAGGGGEHGWMSGSSTNSEHNGSTMNSTTNSNSRTYGLSNSETSTDTTSVSMSNSASVGGSTGGTMSTEVSSSTSDARMFSSYIPSHEFGVFYRQTTRLVRRGLLVTYNLCGVSTVVGQADFSDWAWAPDLATATACPPLPISNLPPAQCYVEPCSGN